MTPNAAAAKWQDGKLFISLRPSGRCLAFMTEYRIEFDECPSPENIKVLSVGLAEYGESVVGRTWYKNAAFYLRDEDGEIAGGVFGNFGSFGWLYIDTLWVSPKLRGRGHGRSLVSCIETEAVKYDCRFSFLSTFSFQAPEFYKKLGYEVFGELADFPGEHQRVFLRKDLS